jgi:hypothetical protein
MRDLLLKDLGWKLFSLALAAGIWVTVKTVSTETAMTTSVNPLAEWKTRPCTNLPVIVMSAAADRREFKVKPDAVDVTVRGSPDVIDGLAEKDIHVTVDLTDIESARDLRKRVDVAAPPGVTVVKIVPPLVDVVVPPKPDKKK